MSNAVSVFHAYRNGQIQKPRVTVGYSWGMIIASYILLWPISFVLLYKRSCIDKESNGPISIIFIIRAAFILFMALISAATLPSTTGDELGAGIIITILFFVWGFLYLYIANRCRKAKIKFINFIDALITNNTRKADELSRVMKLSPIEVKNYLNELVMSGYFWDASVKDGVITINEEVERKSVYEHACDCQEDDYADDEDIISESEEGYDKNGNYYSKTKVVTNSYTTSNSELSDSIEKLVSISLANENGEVEFNKALNSVLSGVDQPHHKKQKKEPRSGTVACKNCGATVELKGFGPVTCEYCDTAN